jgi:hypothetical protein
LHHALSRLSPLADLSLCQRELTSPVFDSCKKATSHTSIHSIPSHFSHFTHSSLSNSHFTHFSLSNYSYSFTPLIPPSVSTRVHATRAFCTPQPSFFIPSFLSFLPPSLRLSRASSACTPHIYSLFSHTLHVPALSFRVCLSPFRCPLLPTLNIRTHRPTHTLRRVSSLLSSRSLEAFPYRVLFHCAVQTWLVWCSGTDLSASCVLTRVLIIHPTLRGRVPPSLFHVHVLDDKHKRTKKGEKRVSVFVVHSADGCLTHHSCY